MNTISARFNPHRRRVLAAASANTSFGTLKQIDAGVLRIGYAEARPPMAPRSFFCTAGPTTSAE